ncbi:YceI family protein [Pedobacter sp. HMF7647]|uniref:YceI family protein n=1 Tax=Hufsiella arboris TaxID=2695275 RepID=A0A7K1Y5J9_9SPHI|nr:YceI family protein [Hufsiella arboris]MXV49863.1 YceI family protein [Hufsiella arboris]
MKHFIAILFCFVFTQSQPPLYTCRSVTTTIFSEAPLENIDATSTKGVSVLNPATGELQFSIPINSYQFQKSLMQEHFNENYMESDKFPFARFKGKINEKIDWKTPGNYQVTVNGDLEVHGVKQARSINGTVSITNSSVTVQSKFTVLCKDHHIDIPKIVFKNIAESIQVTVKANYTPSTASK